MNSSVQVSTVSYSTRRQVVDTKKRLDSRNSVCAKSGVKARGAIKLGDNGLLLVRR